MIISSEQGKIEISDAALSELIGLVVRDSIGVSEMAPKNLTENLVGLLGFDGRGRGVSLRQENDGLVVELSMQFWRGLGIAECVVGLINGIQELLGEHLGISLLEVHVEVAGTTERAAASASRNHS